MSVELLRMEKGRIHTTRGLSGQPRLSAGASYRMAETSYSTSYSWRCLRGLLAALDVRFRRLGG